DYVVRSFNTDKPYDRFVIEQIAGDELAGADAEALIGVGFLRMGPWEHTGMSVAAETRQHFLDDVTHSVGVTFLGQPLRCARCHDYKFDPIPTRDYYRIQAVFAPEQFVEGEVPFQPWENTTGFAESRARADRRLKEARAYLAKLKEKQAVAVAALLKKHGVKTIAELPLEERTGTAFIGLTSLEKSLRKMYQKRV